MSWYRRRRRRRPAARRTVARWSSSSDQRQTELLLHEQRRCAEHDHIVLDVAELDLRVACEQWQDARPGVPSDLVEPVSAELRDRADQQHVLNVEHADQPADRDTK